MNLPQLHYTWAPPGPDGSGFRFTAVTAGVPVALLREAERLLAYEPPPGGRAGVLPEALSLSLLSDGSRLLARSVCTGGAEAPGLFHAHAVHLPQRPGSGPVRGALPITSWGSPQWAVRTPPGGPLPPLAAVPVPGRHDRDALAEFVAARGPWLAPFFADVRRLVEERGAPRIVLVEPDSAAVARWVMLACSVLPHQRGQWLTFTTYTRRPRLAPQGLIGILPGEETPTEEGYRIYEPARGPAPAPPDDVWARAAAQVWLAGRPDLLAKVRTLPGRPYAPGPLAALTAGAGIPLDPQSQAAATTWTTAHQPPAAQPTTGTTPAAHPERRTAPPTRPTTGAPPAAEPAAGATWAAEPEAEAAPLARPTAGAPPAAEAVPRAAPTVEPEAGAAPAAEPAAGTARAAEPTGGAIPTAQPGLRTAAAAEPVAGAASTAGTASVAEPPAGAAPAAQPATGVAPAMRPERRTAPTAGAAQPVAGTAWTAEPTGMAVQAAQPGPGAEPAPEREPRPAPTSEPGLPAPAAEPRLSAAPTPEAAPPPSRTAEPEPSPAPTAEPGLTGGPALEPPQLPPAPAAEPGPTPAPAPEPGPQPAAGAGPELSAAPTPAPGPQPAKPELPPAPTPAPGPRSAAGAEAGLRAGLADPGREPEALAGLLREAARQGVDTTAQLPEAAPRLALALFSDPGRAYGEETRAALTELPVLRALVLDRLDALAAGEPAAGVRLFARTELRLGAAEALPHLRMCARAATVAESAPDRVVALDALLRASGVSLYAEPLVLRTAMRLVWGGDPPEPGEAGLVLATTGAAVHRDAGTWELLAEAAARAPADDPTAAHLATELLRHFTPDLPPGLRATLSLHTAAPGRLPEPGAAAARPGRHRQAKPGAPGPDTIDAAGQGGEPRTTGPLPEQGGAPARSRRHRQGEPGVPGPHTADARQDGEPRTTGRLPGTGGAPGRHRQGEPTVPGADTADTGRHGLPGAGGASSYPGLPRPAGPATPRLGGADVGRAPERRVEDGWPTGTGGGSVLPGVGGDAGSGVGWGADVDPVGGMLDEGLGVRVLFESEDARLLAAYRQAARDDRVRERLLASPRYLADCFAVWSAHPQAGPLWQETRTDLLEEVLRPVVRSLPPERLAEAERELARIGRSRAEEFRAWRRPGLGARLRGLLTRRADR
ncbi:GTPase-associated protein 1-related protein [Streptomyces sp. NPDC059564]|uniref:GTPase-associated protein 1-related protein n=1 Tax=Streptomyces sp. NPDC059564 TaxID=3346865 RepID=UPI00367DA792